MFDMKKWIVGLAVAGCILALSACNAENNDMMDEKPAHSEMSEQNDMKSDEMMDDSEMNDGMKSDEMMDEEMKDEMASEEKMDDM
jgi:hypothetical protein